MGSSGMHRSTQAFPPSRGKSPARVGTDRASLACAAASRLLQQRKLGNPHSRGRRRSLAPSLFSLVLPPRRSASVLTRWARPLHLALPVRLASLLDRASRANVRKAGHEDECAKTAALRDLH